MTPLLHAWRQGDQDALDRLAPIVYDELHRLAAAYMRRERREHTFTPTALVSEVFLRMCGGEPATAGDRVEFFAFAARHMRRILVDHARRRTAGKRGGRNRPITFDDALVAAERPADLLALDEALDALAVADERKARVVELYYFGGMRQQEIALALAVHENTVARDLRLAEAWIRRQMVDAG